MDTIEYALVVAHKEIGELKLRNFNDFAIWGDSLPTSLFWKYEYVEPSRLLTADCIGTTRFLISKYLTKAVRSLIDTNTVSRTNKTALNDKMRNWADSIPNSKYSNIYTWLDLKLVKDRKDSIEIALLDTMIRISLNDITHMDMARHKGEDILKTSKTKIKLLEAKNIEPLSDMLLVIPLSMCIRQRARMGVYPLPLKLIAPGRVKKTGQMGSLRYLNTKIML